MRTVTPEYTLEVDEDAVRRLASPSGPMGPRLSGLVEVLARTVHGAIVSQMEDAPPRTGREYFIPGTSTKYTASAPGAPPAIREGVYRESWDIIPPVVDGKRIVAYVVSDLQENGHFIGLMLELGTTRMEPRPHILPALVGVESELRAIVRRWTS